MVTTLRLKQPTCLAVHACMHLLECPMQSIDSRKHVQKAPDVGCLVTSQQSQWLSFKSQFEKADSFN